MTTYNSTTQRSWGRAILTSINDVGNFLAWTGTDTKQNICFNFQRDAMTFSNGRISDDGVRCSNYSPDLVVLPNRKTAYITWADKNNVVKITKMSRAQAPDKISWSDWYVDGDDISISGSKAASGPCAGLGQQNGQIVLNVLWQDSTKNKIAFTQLPIIFGPSSPVSLEMELLDGDIKASSTPALVMTGGGSFLAYFDEDKQFNLAFDSSGGLSFNSPQKIQGVTSSFGPAFLPTGSGQAYLFWVDETSKSKTPKLRYQQLGTIAKGGSWALNPTEGCGGTISGAVPSGAPSVQIVSTKNPDTQAMEKNFRVAWPEKETGTKPDGSRQEPHAVLYTSNITISHAAMPVVIVTSI